MSTIEHEWKTVHREQATWSDDISIWQECVRCGAVRELKDTIKWTKCPTCGHEKVVDGTAGIIGAHEWVSRRNARGEESPCRASET
jgi:hypothetical protein